jgi:FkbM family methyltransferase
MTKNRLKEPEVIWEIGSRDGREAQSLSVEFPGTRVIAFEPNPETFPFVVDVASKNPQIIPRDEAISNLDGFVDFFKINTSETITSWTDGNPGASSLLKSSGDYPHETYVQDKIKVKSTRASEFIRHYPEYKPQLLWIDVQGSEDQVLLSFDEFIEEIEVIVVELSLKPIYRNQPLAQEVLKLLKENFYLVKILNMGEWQFDALLVNKNKKRAMNFWSRDKIFATSLRTKRKFGIARHFPRLREILIPRFVKICDALIEKLTRIIKAKRENNPKFFIDFSMRMTKSRIWILDQYWRKIAEALLPVNPLRFGENLPAISVVIPVIKKDFSTLGLVITQIIKSSLNPISSITVVYGGVEKPNIDNLHNEHIRIIHESELVTSVLEERIKLFPQNRQGWIRQQVVKFKAVGNSETEGTLICDADTFLIQKRIWLNAQGEQQIQISHEYFHEYEDHFLKAFEGKPDDSRKVSFVTHHQLMQKTIVHQMFGQDLQQLINWLDYGNLTSMSSISEYHSYGRFITQRYPEKCLFSRWNNLFIKNPGEDIQNYINLYSQTVCSISVHKY